MSKVAVVYWSGTGNTEAMAQAVCEGAKAAGADADMFAAADFSADKIHEELRNVENDGDQSDPGKRYAVGLMKRQKEERGKIRGDRLGYEPEITCPLCFIVFSFRAVKKQLKNRQEQRNERKSASSYYFQRRSFSGA